MKHFYADKNTFENFKKILRLYKHTVSCYVSRIFKEEKLLKAHSL